MPLDREAQETLDRYEKERNQGKTHKVVRLPCCGNKIEITKPGDQYIKCADCNHSFLLTWSKLGNHKIKGGA